MGHFFMLPRFPLQISQTMMSKVPPKTPKNIDSALCGLYDNHFGQYQSPIDLPPLHTTEPVSHPSPKPGPVDNTIPKAVMSCFDGLDFNPHEYILSEQPQN